VVFIVVRPTDESSDPQRNQTNGESDQRKKAIKEDCVGRREHRKSKAEPRHEQGSDDRQQQSPFFESFVVSHGDIIPNPYLLIVVRASRPHFVIPTEGPSGPSGGIYENG